MTMRSCRALGVAAGLIALSAVVPGAALSARPRFSDDFEKGLDGWDLYGDGEAFVQPSGDPAHRKVLVLRASGDVLALVRGSERWGAVLFEGEFKFPDAGNGYLGVAYNHRLTGGRHDFGLISVRANGSFLTPDPHRDFNTGRLLYEEYRTMLDGDAAIRVGEWQRFRLEVVGNTAHFYVGAGVTPQLTFPLFELESGALGLKPRAVGGDVWVDNVSISSIDRFSYQGPPRPFQFQYDPEALLTEWTVAGPMARTDDALAHDPDARPDVWKPFATDARGAVVTGRVVDYHGPDAVAYFRAQVATD
jgi:hypothetical protein